MPNLIFRGDAVPVAQVVQITPSTPEPGDTFTIKINGKDVSFVATDNLVATVVDGLVNAWNTADFPEANQITATNIDTDGAGLNDYLELTANNQSRRAFPRRDIHDGCGGIRPRCGSPSGRHSRDQ